MSSCLKSGPLEGDSDIKICTQAFLWKCTWERCCKEIKKAGWGRGRSLDAVATEVTANFMGVLRWMMLWSCPNRNNGIGTWTLD